MCYSFDPILIFIQFNPSLFIQSSFHSHLFNFGVWVERKNLSWELGPIAKIAAEMGKDKDFQVKSFFEHEYMLFAGWEVRMVKN